MKKTIFISQLLKTLIAIMLFSVASIVQAQPSSDSDSDIEIEEKKPRGDFWKYEEIITDQHTDAVSQSLGFVLNKSHQFANWVDHFFDDDRTRGIKNTTRIKLGYWAFQDKDNKYNDSDFKFNIRIKLPGLQKRAQFILTNDPDDDLSSSPSGGVFPDQVRDDETVAGFRFFDLAGLGKKIPGQFSTAMGVGYSDNSPTFRIEPRYIHTHDFNIWSTTFLQKVRWHSRDGWSAETRLDFDRALSKKYFLRFNNEIFWEEKQEDFDGFEFRPRVILSRRFSNKQALLYEWNNLFRSEPSSHLHTTSLAVRYRRQIWRPWLFFEVSPQVAFRDDEDWKAAPGIFAKVELLLLKKDK